MKKKTAKPARKAKALNQDLKPRKDAKGGLPAVQRSGKTDLDWKV